MRRAKIGIGSITGTAAAGLTIALVAAGAPAAHGQGSDQPPRVLASNGAVVEMPEIGDLDCTGMAAALKRLDLSDYRRGELLPPGHPDWAIFEYEDRLARRFYGACVLEGQVLGDPGAAFSRGFEPE